jgi:integrase
MGMLAAFGGLRAAEIAQVHARDLVGDELIVHGKGGKVRAVPVLDGRLFARLQLLDGWAFPNGHGDHITPGHASRLLSRALPDGWTAHTLRHRCASVAYAATRDLLAVGALLGHSRPETTQRYVAMPNDAIRAAAAAAVMVA